MVRDMQVIADLKFQVAQWQEQASLCYILKDWTGRDYALERAVNAIECLSEYMASH